MKVTDVIKYDEGVMGGRIGGGTKCVSEEGLGVDNDVVNP